MIIHIDSYVQVLQNNNSEIIKTKQIIKVQYQIYIFNISIKKV